MKKGIIVAVVLILLLVGSFFGYKYFWKGDFFCKDLNGLTLAELQVKLDKVKNPCCKCKVQSFIEMMMGEGLCRSCCDDDCRY